MYQCKCGKAFEKNQSYVAHCSHCKIHLGYDPKDRFGDSRAWSRGKTKQSDDRVLRISEKNKLHQSNFSGHNHSEATKQLMSKRASYNAKNHINGWKAGSSKIPNKYELYAEEFLKERSIPYEREVTIAQSALGGVGSYYQLDFLINGLIDLEIDGSSHNSAYDSVRDSYVSRMYKVYRISHNDSLEELKDMLELFVATIG